MFSHLPGGAVFATLALMIWALLTAFGAAIAAGVFAHATTRKRLLAEVEARRARARGAAEALVVSARAQAQAEAKVSAAEAALAARNAEQQAFAALREAQAALDTREAAAVAALATLHADAEAIAQRQSQLDAAARELQAQRDRAQGIEQDAERRLASIVPALQTRAGVAARELIDTLSNQWLSEARMRAASLLRNTEVAATDPSVDREAKRVMEIASSRYRHHYLTERNVATLRCGTGIVTALTDNSQAMLLALQQTSGITLHVSDDRDAIRMEGIDGVGREIVRRAVGRLEKKAGAIDAALRDPSDWVAKAHEAVSQEIRTLGKRAFAVLGVAKAHPEITELVGALTYRTSYTQNQWWHAVEAAYLAGMIAAEMGLDEKLARRATLLHDIGKALTHKIDGSHAVIGADIARRLGEPEIIANAIGSHHNDEPQNSVYAYLVAAADAMSGARPGARREMAEGFSAKVEDLERIGMDRRGVVSAHAVHGGRELRVYVRERDVDDATVVEMSSDIAAQISEEMTFPGQIKVTVIRAFEAAAVAN